MARNASRLKLGYYPLVTAEALRLRRLLGFPPECAVLDPCAGTGAALRRITDETQARRYGIELDSFRAMEAQRVLDEVVQGSVFDAHCPVESYSLLYLNPPYDDEIADGRNRRMEGVFLEHCFRWLRPGGILVLVIPGNRIGSCSDVLAPHFRELGIYRLTDPDAARYSQIAVLGIRRTRRERERLHDRDVAAARELFVNIGRNYARLSPLPDQPDRIYSVPPSAPNVRLSYRGLPMDLVEDLLSSSRAYRQAGRVLFAPEVEVRGRPLTPLHAGHVGPIRNIADFSCKPLTKRLFFRWRHSIGKMFYRMRLLPRSSLLLSNQ